MLKELLTVNLKLYLGLKFPKPLSLLGSQGLWLARSWGISLGLEDHGIEAA